MMSGFLARAARLVDQIISAPYPAPRLLKIPTSQCYPSENWGRKIPKDEAYFSFRINELFLKEGRSLWDTFDPMVVMITEFVHGEQRLSVPFVVGSGLFGRQPGRLPHGLLFNDILAAGPHPFRGGNVSISLVLYRVKRDNYAKGVLKFVESISSAVGIPANIGFLTKVGDAFIDGLEALLNLQDTVPIMGHRIEIDASTADGLLSSYWVLTSETNVSSSQIVVEKGRLAIQGTDGIRQPFNSSDYVLYSLTGSSRRGDESTLPFYPLRKQALKAVLSGEEGWKRSKATLLSMYEQMASSDDLIAQEADELFEKYKADVIKAREGFNRITTLSTSGAIAVSGNSRLDRATALLDLN